MSKPTTADATLLPQPKIQLVVCDGHTLGFTTAEWNYVGILQSSIPKGSPFGTSKIIDPKPKSLFKDIRLANEQDFHEFNVWFDGFKNDPDYQYSLT